MWNQWHVLWKLVSDAVDISLYCKGRGGRDRRAVGFTTTCAINVYHHKSCEFESRSWRGVLDTILCDKICQWLAKVRWFLPGIPVSSTNKTGRHEIQGSWNIAESSVKHHNPNIHIANISYQGKTPILLTMSVLDQDYSTNA